MRTLLPLARLVGLSVLLALGFGLAADRAAGFSAPSASTTSVVAPDPPRAPREASGGQWLPGLHPDGVNGWTDALAVDGSGNTYVGGYFNLVGTLPVRNIARWDGANWSALGHGVDGEVLALAWDNLHRWLYVGGNFKNICANADCTGKIYSRGIARWDPSAASWKAMGYGVNGIVFALALDPDGNLYMGGDFTTVCYDAACTLPGLVVNNIVKWTPSTELDFGTWSALPTTGVPGVSGGRVKALAWWNAPPWIGTGVMVVGGDFTAASGIPMNNLAYWTPGAKTWNSFWGGTDGPVYTLAVVDGGTDPTQSRVFVGGNFQNLCDDMPPNCSVKRRVNRLAEAFGLTSWGSVNFGVMGAVHDLSVDRINRHVYVAGAFAGTCVDQNCASWTSDTNIVEWDFSSSSPAWSALGVGADSATEAVAWNSSAHLLYAGGHFERAGSGLASGLATWNGSVWSPIGSGTGPDETIYAAVADGKGRVYIGGSFRAVGSLAANRVAVWNEKTGTWSALGRGLDGDVYALALDANGVLYAGGSFTSICPDTACTNPTQAAHAVAKWNGSPGGDSGQWEQVGLGLWSYVSALAFDHQNRLYVGGLLWGYCQDAICTPIANVHGIAIWDGKSWASVGTGLNFIVSALAVDKDDQVYAGGHFSYICGSDNCSQIGQTALHIARWTPAAGGGGSWSAVGNGLDGDVQALVIDRHNTLFAGGYFTHICGSPSCVGTNPPAFKVAQWKNGNWSAVGNGMQGIAGVHDLELDEWDNLFAGGVFQNLCGDADCYTPGPAANNIAHWNGSSWTPLGSGIGPSQVSTVWTLTYFHHRLVAGGNFGTAGDQVSANFARYAYGVDTYLPMTMR